MLEIAQGRAEEEDDEKGIKIDVRKAVGGYKPSTKINALIKLLHQYNKESHKTVVFSQFTSFLDIVGEALDYERIHFTRLDGSHSQAQREKVLSTFAKMDQNGANVLLISLRAGGVGLNLTCASRVVMMVNIFFSIRRERRNAYIFNRTLGGTLQLNHKQLIVFTDWDN